ncbi:MAG: ATP-dependent DNA helicase RecG [Planctomycetaceae bacterium]
MLHEIDVIDINERDEIPSLETPVQFIPGVGPARAPLLERLELKTAEDLLFNVPRDVLDLSRVTSVKDLKADTQQSVKGIVVDRDARLTHSGMTITAVLLDCGDGYVRGVWFNQPWMINKFDDRQAVMFSGKPKWKTGRFEFSNPVIQYLDSDDAEGTVAEVLPRYRLTEGLRMAEMRRIERATVERFADLIVEHVPDELLARHKLPRRRDCVRNLHVPKTMADYDAAKRRLIFEDLLEFQIGLALRRRAWKRGPPAPPLPVTAKIDARARRLFSFQFTAGQNRAVAEICRDLATDQAMHRLFQADVGAGKTAVAIYAMLVAVANGHQALIMAPTELLATQHWNTIDSLLAESRVERRLLTGSLTESQRRQTLAEIESGVANLVIGTQALIQKDVKFAKLGLVVIDEQHKFGVEQRAHFGHGGLAPHVLVMTATPIPRSLCLTQFGDLDVTSITDLPPGRQKISTSRVFSEPTRKRAWDFIRQQLNAGRQAYIVCPRVGASDGADESSVVEWLQGLAPGAAKSSADMPLAAEEAFAKLSVGELKGFRVGLVHGRVPREERTATMDRFRSGEIQALIATTVIEVGVDVHNATMMTIFHAERFGLSQLHQLRGRVGRGKFQGYCFLFSDNDEPDALRRLHAVESSTDGFQIAEADFELRGPGDVLGTRQHGEMPLRFADIIRDQKLLVEARQAACDAIDTGAIDTAEYAPLKLSVLDRYATLMDLPQTG